MTINQTTANSYMDAIAFTLTKTIVSLDPTTMQDMDKLCEQVENLTRAYFIEFCDAQGIDDIEEIAEIPLNMFEDVEEEDYDFPDDVDETNYDPYMGCDFFETCDCDEGW